jgi:hypothetical protein
MHEIDGIIIMKLYYLHGLRLKVPAPAPAAASR